VCDPVKVDLELIELTKYLGVASNLGVGSVDDVACAVVLNLSEHLSLFAQVLYILLDVGHKTVEVTAEGGKGGAVEQ
jgi:hypothetical protein